MLTQLLYELDNDNEVKNDHEIWMKIHPISCIESSFECDAEKLAFYISEKEGMHIQSKWEFFYPTARVKGEQGLIDDPAIEDITKEIIEYWKIRSDITNNLYMKVRYTGLVLVFDKIINKKFQIQILYNYIELLITISKIDTDNWLDSINYALRAMDLSKKYNSGTHINNSIQNLIDLENKIFDFNYAASWGFCFEKLILGKESNLTESHKEEIIIRFTDRYSTFFDIVKEPYLLTGFLNLLLKYYRSIDDFVKVAELLTNYSEKMIENVSQKRAIVAVAELKSLHDLLIENQMHQKAEEILVLIKGYSTKIIDDLTISETTHQITNEQMKIMIDENTQGDFEPTLLRLILKNVISKRYVLNERAKHISQFPLLGIFGATIVDTSGRPTAKIETDDEEGIAFTEMKKTIILGSGLFNLFLKELLRKNNKSCQDIVDYIQKSPFFIPENKEILFKGIDAFLKEDHITSVHLLVPQIESAFRNAVEFSGGNVLRENRFDGFNYQTLDGLINNDIIKTIFHDDSETIFYFRSVLSEPRGLNIRNDVCHGILRAEDINFSHSLLVVHVILLLAQVK